MPSFRGKQGFLGMVEATIEDLVLSESFLEGNNIRGRSIPGHSMSDSYQETSSLA
jgi:hypothetical protein